MTRHRFNDLLGMRIRYADGRDGAQVIDARLSPSERVPGPLAELSIAGLVVGKMRPGTLFGYERRRHQGPWLIRVVVHLLHKDTGYVSWEDVAEVDWEHAVIRLRVNEVRDIAEVGTG